MDKNDLMKRYNDKQLELLSIDRLLQQLDEEQKEREKFFYKIDRDYENIRLFKKNLLKFQSTEIVRHPNPITAKTKRIGIRNKLVSLKENSPLNKYFLSENISDDDRKYNKIEWYIYEYNCITLRSIVYDHEYLTNINLPYKMINSVIASSIKYITDNKSVYSETDSENNFNYHNTLLDNLNNNITDSIYGLFNNPFGEQLNSIINKYEYYRFANYIDCYEFLRSISESDIDSVLTCLIALNVPYDLKIIRPTSSALPV